MSSAVLGVELGMRVGMNGRSVAVLLLGMMLGLISLMSWIYVGKSVTKIFGIRIE